MAAVEGEPLRESAHRALISAYLAEGNPGEALRQYRFFARCLHDQLDLEPVAADGRPDAGSAGRAGRAQGAPL